MIKNIIDVEKECINNYIKNENNIYIDQSVNIDYITKDKDFIFKEQSKEQSKELSEIRRKLKKEIK